MWSVMYLSMGQSWDMTPCSTSESFIYFMSIKYSHRPYKHGVYPKKQSSLRPQNTRVIQCGPHSMCCYTITEGRRIQWGIWLCLEPKGHLMENWGWTDGKWMKGLLVPRQGHMGRRKCEKNRMFVSLGIWGGWTWRTVWILTRWEWGAGELYGGAE